MRSPIVRQLVTALRAFVVLTVILGIGYPVLVTGLGRLGLSDRADGQLLHRDGQVVGSALIGQSFAQARWFHSRPSANDYDGLASASSNLGPSNRDLLTAIAKRRAQVASTEGVPPSKVPPDAVTASASGLDPSISPAYAAIQVARVARVNHLSVATVRHLVAAQAHGRQLGFLGEPKVSVLRLNLAVQQAARQ